MRFKVITKNSSVDHYFETERRAVHYAKHFHGKIIDTRTKKMIYDFCLRKDREK
jgi:hypothetical protein